MVRSWSAVTTAKDGCGHGSWDSDQERWGAEGSRVYTTAMGALILETYYRYARVTEKMLRDREK